MDFAAAALLILGGLYFMQKSRALEAEAENLETKEKLAELSKEIVKADASLEIEEEKRKTVREEMEKKTNEVLSPEEIADFFNRRK